MLREYNIITPRISFVNLIVNGDSSGLMMISEHFNKDFRNFAMNRFIIGDKMSVLDEIIQYRDELNIDHLICRVEWPELENDKVIQTIKLLGECAKLL